MKPIKAKAVSLIVLVAFAFALAISLETTATAEDPPVYVICCTENNWCASDTSLVKYGWPDEFHPEICRYEVPPPWPWGACLVQVPFCREL